jgi:hypothetical protein
MELFVKTHVRSQDRQKGMQQYVDNRAQHFVVCSINQIILLVIIFLNWIWWFFKKKIQETYNSRLRERCGDDPLTQPDFNPDLWMEVGSSGGPDKNQVYGLSNTTVDKLWSARSVSTFGSSPLVLSTQSEEFLALKQQYERLSTDYA